MCVDTWPPASGAVWKIVQSLEGGTVTTGSELLLAEPLASSPRPASGSVSR